MEKEIRLRPWSEITILEYLQYIDIANNQKEDDEASKFRKALGLISVLSGIDYDILRKIDYNQIIKLASLLQEVKPLTTIKLKPIYKIKDITFKVCYDLNKISTAQYIDLLELSKQDYVQNIHKILSLFFIPTEPKKTPLGFIKHNPVEYGSYDVTEVADLLLNNLSIEIANSIMVFFYHNYESLIQTTLNCLVKKIMKMKKLPKQLKAKLKKLKTIKKDGDGYQQLIELLKELEEVGMKFGN